MKLIETKPAKKAIMNAAIEILQTVPYDKITITAICDKAGVSRQAFYNNFENTDDIFRSIYIEMLRAYCLPKIENVNYFHSNEFITALVDVYDRNSDLFIALDKWAVYEMLARDSFNAYVKIVTAVYKDKYVQKYPDYFVNYIFMPVTSVCMRWLKNGKKESREEIIAMLRHFNKLR